MLIPLSVSLFSSSFPFVSILTLFRLTLLFPESHFLKRLFSKPQIPNSLHFSRLCLFSQRDVLFPPTLLLLASSKPLPLASHSPTSSLAPAFSLTHTHTLSHSPSIHSSTLSSYCLQRHNSFSGAPGWTLSINPYWLTTTPARSSVPWKRHHHPIMYVLYTHIPFALCPAASTT